MKSFFFPILGIHEPGIIETWQRGFGEKSRLTTRLKSCHRLLGLAALMIPIMLTGPTTQALAQQVHEIHITPGIQSAPLSLDSWLGSTTSPFPVEVLSPPQFGAFDGESFTPAEEFWLAGGDQMTLRLTIDQVDWDHTIYLTPQRIELIDNDENLVDFESGDFPTTWHSDTTGGAVLGIASANEEPQLVFSGQHGLVVAAPNVGDSGYSGSFSGTGEGEGAGAATGYGGTVLSPPDPIFTPGSVKLVAYLAPDDPSAPLVFVETQLLESGEYEMRAALSDSLACSSCATPWRSVPADEPIFFELWSGSRANGPSPAISEGSWALRFTLKRPSPAPMITDWLEEKVEIGRYRVGVMDPVDMAGFRAGFDQLLIEHALHPYIPRMHLGEGFEGGELATGWDSRGDLAASGKDPISGFWSLDINQEDMGVAGSDTVIIDPTPSVATEFSAQLSFDISDLDLAVSDQLELIKAGSIENLSSGLHLSLLLRRSPGGYILRARARNDQQALHKTAWISLAGNTHKAAIHWRASSASGANDGMIRLLVDGALVGQSLGIDNDTKVIEGVAYGAFNTHQSTTALPPDGVLKIDNVVSFY